MPMQQPPPHRKMCAAHICIQIVFINDYNKYQRTTLNSMKLIELCNGKYIHISKLHKYYNASEHYLVLTVILELFGNVC